MKKKMKRILGGSCYLCHASGKACRYMLPEEMRSGQGMMRARRSGCRSMI